MQIWAIFGGVKGGKIKVGPEGLEPPTNRL